MVAAWLLERLCCPRCRQGKLAEIAGALSCACGARYRVDRGVADLLEAAPSAVRAERAAVEAIDRGEASLGERDPAAARERHLRRTRAELEEVLERLELPAGSVVVELGADDCWASSLFLARGCRVIAVDITDHLHLARPEITGHADCARLRADMNRLPLAEGGVDLVVAIAAAHHSWSLPVTLAEAHRVLRPGGRLALCCEPMPSWLRHALGRRTGKRERLLGINETWIRRGRWLRLAREAGFEARLVLPTLDRMAIRERLAERGLPPMLAPAAGAVLGLLQVSVHLIGRRR